MRTSGKLLGLLLLSIATVPPSNAAPGTGVEAFNRLKSLVGHWEAEKGNTVPATLDLELTSGGTAILEKFHMVDDGKPVEMTTLYYLDGDHVKLTHYCMAGNQPTMKGSYDLTSNTLTFDLISITNLKSADDGHMHHAVYSFLDNDHFKTTWTFAKQQKDAFTEEVIYVRKK